MSIRRWKQELDCLVEFLAGKTSSRAVIIVTGIPKVSSYVQVGPLVGRILDDDSLRFSAIAEAACARTPKANFVVLPPVEKSDFVDGGFSYATLYRRWGAFLAALAIARLNA